MKKIIIVLATVVAAIATDAAPGPQRQPGQHSSKQMARHARRGSDGRGRSHRDGDDQLSRREERLIEDIEEADSLHELRRYLQAAASSRSEEVRMAMVSALENKGKRSAADLAYFIADPSEDVADAAFSAWTSILDDASVDRRVSAIMESAKILQECSGGRWHGNGSPGHAMPPPAMPVASPAVVPATTVPMTAPVTVPATTVPTATPVAVPVVQ